MATARFSKFVDIIERSTFNSIIFKDFKQLYWNYITSSSFIGSSAGRSEVKASVGNAGNLGSIPGREDPLEKEMATHSSILAWRIPWTEKPGGLQFTGSQRVGHD